MNIFELFPNKKIIDDNTGLIKGIFIKEYLEYLSLSNIAYGLAIMEFDNLLNILDTCGRDIAARIFALVCKELKKELGDSILLAEHENDSILIVLPTLDSYDKVHAVFNELYSKNTAIRRNYTVDGIDYYITTTVGAAIYPADTANHNELINLVNKALYRGKYKGRNCFIVYVHSKHKDIIIDNNAKVSYSALMDDIASSFRLCSPMDTFLENVLRMIKEALKITGAFFIDNESNMITSKSIGLSQLASLTVSNFELILKSDSLVNTNIESIYEDVLRKKLIENNMNSFIIKKVIFGQKNFGYVGFYSNDTQKLWTAEDVNLLVHIEKLIGMSRTLENPSTMLETRKSLYVNKIGEIVDVYTLNSPLFEGLAKTAERSYMFSKNLLSNIVRWDQNAVEYFDLPDEYFVDSSGIWINKIHPDDVNEYIASRDAVINGETEYQNIDYRILNKQGEYIVCTSKAVKIRNNEGYELLVGTVENHGIANRIDATTNLYSTSEFNEVFKAYKEKGIKTSVLYIGINNFTQINDLYGYSFGNKVLSTVSAYFQYIARNNIHVFKMDGVKFAFIFEDMPKIQIDEIYEKIRIHLKNYILVDKIKVNLNISGGVVYDTAEFNSDSVQTSCKYALLQSKSLKTGKLIFFDEELLSSNVKNVALINELRMSIANSFKGFQIYYQPVVYIKNSQIYGAEALLRWSSEKLGFVSPGVFMSWLETDPSFYELGNWILQQSMTEAISFLTKYPDFTLNVNIAYTQLSNPNFKSDLLDIISKVGYPVKNLCLEITERCRQLDRDFLCNEIEELRSLGIKIAIDDFGTGTATLNLLNDLSVDVIKIDRSFIINILTNKKCQAIIQAITSCANDLNIKVCCEGIEDKEVLDFISKYYINTYQGYYYSRPIPYLEFLDKFINK